MALPIRRPVRGAQRVRTARRPPLVTVGRLAGLGLMLLASVAVNWLAGTEDFRLDPARVEISGLRFTDEAQVRERLGLAADERPNAFRLRTAGMAAEIAALPTVATVEVAVVLPARLAVRVVEREPLFGWQTRDRTLLVDGGGTFIAEVASLPPDLPAVEDRRAATQAVAPGERLGEVDLAAVLRLAAVTPDLLASASSGLRLSVDDVDGYVLSSADPPWRAVFGIYTASLRRPEDNIDRQVQCLRSLLAQDERAVAVAYLAVADDRCGTVRQWPTPTGHIFQNVARQPSPPARA